MARRLTQEQFLEKSRIVHGDKYDYSLSAYLRNSKHVKIICRDHGEFMQAPGHHMIGKGCNKCGRKSVSDKKKLPFSEFLDRATSKHGDRFEYDEESYESMDSKVRIKCSDHGWFEVLPLTHIKSDFGCRKCGHQARGDGNSFDTSEFIRRARKTHGDTYSYEKSVYTLSKNNITITCSEHGDFLQIPSNHIFGSGCPSCAKNGFRPDTPSILYLLRSDCGSMMKIGITKNLAQRENQLKRATPFDFEIEAVVRANGSDVMQMEKYYHSKSMSCEFTGFHGCSEWFRYDPAIAEEIKKGA